MLESLRRLFLRGNEPPVGNGPVGLANVLDRGRLELFYQPKIELKGKHLVGAEGLVRARHPSEGLLSPGAFLPGASEDAPLNITDITLEPGTTVGEALEAVGLTGYVVRTKSGDILDARDNLYTRIQDGEKLFAAPRMDVG